MGASLGNKGFNLLKLRARRSTNTGRKKQIQAKGNQENVLQEKLEKKEQRGIHFKIKLKHCTKKSYNYTIIIFP